MPGVNTLLPNKGNKATSPPPRGAKGGVESVHDERNASKTAADALRLPGNYTATLYPTSTHQAQQIPYFRRVAPAAPVAEERKPRACSACRGFSCGDGWGDGCARGLRCGWSQRCCRSDAWQYQTRGSRPSDPRDLQILPFFGPCVD